MLIESLGDDNHAEEASPETKWNFLFPVFQGYGISQ